MKIWKVNDEYKRRKVVAFLCRFNFFRMIKTAGMLLHIDGKVTMGKFKSSLLS
jgi:hypothetical protein